MPLVRNVPPPLSDPISDDKTRLLTNPWIDYFTYFQEQLNRVPARVASVTILNGDASVAATDMTDGTLPDGTYELQWWYGVTIPAAASSQLQVTFTSQYKGATRTDDGPNLVGNTTNEHDTDTILIPVTGGTPVTYTVTYVTGLGAAMEYDLFVSLRQVQL